MKYFFGFDVGYKDKVSEVTIVTKLVEIGVPT